MAKKDQTAEETPKEEKPAKRSGSKPTGNLFTRMARILAKIEMIPKEGENTYHEYKYVKEDTLTEQIRPMLAEEGISLVFGAEEIILAENCITLVRCTFTIGCDVGEPIVATVWGAGRDADRNHQRGDKGVYKAMTGSMKYFLYKTFLVSTGDDVERDDQPDQPQQLTPGQLKELEKFKDNPQLDQEVNKWIWKMINDGGSQSAAARIIIEAKKQIKAFATKQKATLDKEQEEKEQGEPPADRPIGAKPEEAPAAKPESDDDIPF